MKNLCKIWFVIPEYSLRNCMFTWKSELYFKLLYLLNNISYFNKICLNTHIQSLKFGSNQYSHGWNTDFSWGLFYWHNLWMIGRVSYIRIYLCYFCFRWNMVSLVQASLQYLMHHVTVSLQQSKITLQNNCINNTSITQLTLSFYFWLKM